MAGEESNRAEVASREEVLKWLEQQVQLESSDALANAFLDDPEAQRLSRLLAHMAQARGGEPILLPWWSLPMIE